MDEHRDDPRALIERMVEAGDGESPGWWDAARVLQDRADEPALAAALAAAGSSEATRAAAGVDVLGQFGRAVGGPFHARRLAALLEVAERDAAGSGRAAGAGSGSDAGAAGGDVASAAGAQDRLLASALTALGHLKDPLAQPALLRCRSHPDAAVRHAVAFALPTVTEAAVPDAGVVQALIDLTGDSDADVRNWACFGLGRLLDVDTPQVRAALAARLDDPDPDTAEEALLGLARRHDERALRCLRDRLSGVS